MLALSFCGIVSHQHPRLRFVQLKVELSSWSLMNDLLHRLARRLQRTHRNTSTLSGWSATNLPYRFPCRRTHEWLLPRPVDQQTLGFHYLLEPASIAINNAIVLDYVV